VSALARREPGIIDRIRTVLGRATGAAAAVVGTVVSKASDYAGSLPWWPSWKRHEWRKYRFGRLIDEGYAANSAVYACVRVYANRLPEPEAHVWRIDQETGDRVREPAHEFRALLAEPNEAMTEPEFWEAFWTYAAIGGSAFIWVERDRAGHPIALWPLHRGQMAPVPDPNGYLAGYLYTFNEGDDASAVMVPPLDVLQYKWAVDPRNPLEGLSPLEVAARAVDTDAEIQSYVYSLLRNDAMPRSVVAINAPIADEEMEALKTRFERQYGRDNRGSVAIVQGGEGVTISRLGSNLQEMAAEVLHNIPESRIAAAFEVPPGMAGLNVALQRPQGLGSVDDQHTREFTTARLVPRWRKAGALVGRLFRQEYDDEGGALVIAFDLGTVEALKANEAEQRAMTRADFLAGILTLDEALNEIGRDGLPAGAGDVYYIPAGYTVTPASALLAPPTPEPDPEDVSDVEDALGAALEGSGAKAGAKAAPRFGKPRITPDEALARRVREREAIEGEFFGDVYRELVAAQEAAIAAIEASYEADGGS
jgi:HK97 family phage portal protein